MSPEEGVGASAPESSITLLAGYATEEEVCAALGITQRTARSWRQQRIGPPWCKPGQLILYPREGFRAYLKTLEVQPLRAGRRRA